MTVTFPWVVKNTIDFQLSLTPHFSAEKNLICDLIQQVGISGSHG